MSQEGTIEKLYILMVNSIDMALLARLMPSLKFVEIQGMAMTDNKTHQVLVSPLPVVEEKAETAEVVGVDNASVAQE